MPPSLCRRDYFSWHSVPLWKMTQNIWAEEWISANSLDSLMVFFFFSLPSRQLFSTHKYFGRILSDHVSVNGKLKRRSLLDSDQNRLAVSSWVQFSGRQLILSLVRHLRWPVNRYFLFFQVDLMSAAGENTVRSHSSEVETFWAGNGRISMWVTGWARSQEVQVRSEEAAWMLPCDLRYCFYMKLVRMEGTAIIDRDGQPRFWYICSEVMSNRNSGSVRSCWGQIKSAIQMLLEILAKFLLFFCRKDTMLKPQGQVLMQLQLQRSLSCVIFDGWSVLQTGLIVNNFRKNYPI